MHFLTSPIILIGFVFVIYVGPITVICELSQLSFHDSPAIREAPGELEAAQDAKALESYESSPTELSDTH